MKKNTVLRPDEELQRAYYDSTASQYDVAHVSAQDEHSLALSVMAALMRFYRIESVVDVGSGTGRAIIDLQQLSPGVRCIGVEPVRALREIGYAKGIGRDVLIDGSGTNLPFSSNSMDLVCEFAVLHHVPNSRVVLDEMTRVAREMIFISDCNFVAQGSPGAQLTKYLLYRMHLWRLAKWIQTGGKGYSVSPEDGIQYSYSVFQDLDYLRSMWKTVWVFPTKGISASNGSTLRSAEHLAVVCKDKR
jgi:ubiquinone/menaquinone biosynthesis C-methylase UbiE